MCVGEGIAQSDCSTHMYSPIIFSLFHPKYPYTSCIPSAYVLANFDHVLSDVHPV